MQFRAPFSRENLHMMLSIDVDKDFPMSWIKTYHQGRVYYTVFGHNEDISWNPALLEYFLAGIQYALGDLKADATPSAKLAGKRKP
jgi:type 1 glutamine amidotransferase